MKYPCAMIQDLLPLYHDNVCAKETQAAVEEHLQTCEPCQAAYQELLRSDSVEPDRPAQPDDPQIQSMKRVRGHLRRRTAAFCLAAVLLFGLAVSGLMIWLNTATIDLPAHMVLDVSGREFNNTVRGLSFSYDLLCGKKYSQTGTPIYATATVELDGETEYILLFSKRITLWESLVYDLTNPDPDLPPGQASEMYATESVRTYWGYWKDQHSGDPPPEAMQHTRTSFVTQAYFLPDPNLMEGFGELYAEQKEDILRNHAVLVWERKF